ncbi:protein MIZU-KUSSEI 1-like [Phragmites australis]|uniref:protein MIZU-KUSSEI 1-like n=1 Tax=Phragmites australis TaxID=29695 RepID=UPI002D78ABDF|nr:protein MIZU-KUSSEI 1-like [Phragmites australis]
MPRTTPSSPLSRATPPLSPTIGGTPSRLAVAPASSSTPQCAIPASPRTPGGAGTSTPPPATPRTPRPEITLRKPSSEASQKRAPAAVQKPSRALRAIRALFRSLPIAPAVCRPASALPRRYTKPHDGHGGSARVTGTFYGHRRARITFAVQERPGSLPSLVLELGVPTGKLMQEISSGGHVRIALECEKKSKNSLPPDGNVSLLEEAMWTAYVNGRRVGYAVRREATEGDLAVMQLLSTVSVGAGVLPGDVVDAPAGAEADSEVAYMRAGFDRVIGSKDSESFYMVSPEGDAGGGTELSIFFVRV